jgi:hypothetical protein
VSPRGRLPLSLRALRQWLRVACAVVTLVVIAAPAALGGALSPVLRQLAEVGHVCKCGMTPGKCGCPECARLERERLSERQPAPEPTLKRDCDDEAPAMPLGAALPAGVVAAVSTSTLPVPRGERIPVVLSTSPHPSTSDEPPTPPPRSALV